MTDHLGRLLLVTLEAARIGAVLARRGLRLDSRQPSSTETSHEMSRPNRRRRDEET